ncbi:MAG: hypothetical protein ACI9ES_003277 [Oceanospirillaceae bacterium]|jgi:hypothetical protein
MVIPNTDGNFTVTDSGRRIIDAVIFLDARYGEEQARV